MFLAAGLLLTTVGCAWLGAAGDKLRPSKDSGVAAADRTKARPNTSLTADRRTEGPARGATPPLRKTDHSWGRAISFKNNGPPPSAPPEKGPLPATTNDFVAGRAEQHFQRASDLAVRAAWYSARAELVEALWLVAQGLDAQHHTQRHTQALNEGLQAFWEADDFAGEPSHVDASPRLKTLIDAHATPVLKQADPSQLTSLDALRRYYDFAEQRLAAAGGTEPVASRALCGLGRLQRVLAEGRHGRNVLGGPKAMAMYRAALAIDPDNHIAANELGVLLGRYGQLAEAKRCLLHSVSVSPLPETWHNLAVVHEALGEPRLAGAARERSRQLAARRGGGVNGINSVRRDAVRQVRWVDTATFASAGGGTQTDPAWIDAPKPSEPAPTPKQEPEVGWLDRLTPWR